MRLTETNRIEFKRELTDDLDLEKEVIAFLNYKEGGMIYIGIDKNGTPVGVEDIDNTMLKIKARIRNNVAPSPLGLFDVTTETIDETKVIKIFLASGSEKPYYKSKYGMSTKGCYIRVGTAAEPMDTNMIEYLFSHRVRNSLRNIKSPRQDLTFRQLHIYYDSKGLQLNENFAKTLELLTGDGSYNYVAYLLADENGNSIKLAKYSGTDRVDLISNNEECFVFMHNFIRIVIPFEKENVVVDDSGNVLENDQKIEKWPEKANLILEAITKDNTVTIAKLEELLDLGHTTIKKLLREMQNEKIISRIGPDKGGHWEIVNNKKK